MDDLLVKVVLGEATAEEQLRVQGWIAESSANARYFRDFQAIWEESRGLAMKSTVDEGVAWDEFQRRVGGAASAREGAASARGGETSDKGGGEFGKGGAERQVGEGAAEAGEKTGGARVVEMRKGYGYGWLRVAAAVLVIVAGGWFYYTYSYKPGQLFSVASGARVLADTLPEGSVVTLNKESSISYQRGFAGSIRKVDMQGEAFFAVASDKDRPFVVNANGVEIKVLGTSFNVKTSGALTEVIVETGMVEINKAGHMVRVGAHEKVIIGDSQILPVKEENQDQLYNYYRTRAFECNGTPLWRLVEKLNEVYKVHIVIGESRLRDLPMTVTFMDASLDEILNVVGKTFGIQVVRNGQEIILK